MKNKKYYRSPDFAKYIVTYLLDLKEESDQAKEEKKALRKILVSGNLSKEEKKELRVSYVQSKILHNALKAVCETAKRQLGYYSIGGKSIEIDESELVNVYLEVTPKESKKSIAPKSGKTPSQKNNNVNDLTLIEGIGPKIQEILNQSEIYTFAELSASSYDKIKKILLSAGPRFNIHNPKTWIDQASLAMGEKWDELRTLQNVLKKGK